MVVDSPPAQRPVAEAEITPAGPPPEAASEAFPALSEAAPEPAVPIARLSTADRRKLLASLVSTVAAGAGDLVRILCDGSGVDPSSEAAALGYLAGPVPIVAAAGALLRAEAYRGARRLQGPLRRSFRELGPGELVLDITPRRGSVRVALGIGEAHVAFAPGVDPSLALPALGEPAAPGVAAAHERDEAAPSTRAVIADGNVAAVVLGILSTIFVDAKSAVVAMGDADDPARRWIAKALEPLIAGGYLRFVPRSMGAALAHASATSSVHVIGTTSEYRAILGGAPGGQGEAGALAKPVTSLLEGVCPVVLAPCLYARDELEYLAARLASSMAAAPFLPSCAPRAVMLPGGWPQRTLFLDLLEDAMAALDDPWSFAPVPEGTEADLLPTSPQPPTRELRVVDVGTSDPSEFFAEATAVCNESLWGTLAAEIVVHPVTLEDPEAVSALRRAVSFLRYGVVGINAWPGAALALGTVPWGAHPFGTPQQPESGSGVAFNPYGLVGIDKAVVRGALRPPVKPLYVRGRRGARTLGACLVALGSKPGICTSLAMQRALLRGLWG